MYHHKKNQEPAADQLTSVWLCTAEACTCWMRENYTFEKEPRCPVCHSEMVKDTKMLPPLALSFTHY